MCPSPIASSSLSREVITFLTFVILIPVLFFTVVQPMNVSLIDCLILLVFELVCNGIMLYIFFQHVLGFHSLISMAPVHLSCSRVVCNSVSKFLGGLFARLCEERRVALTTDASLGRYTWKSFPKCTPRSGTVFQVIDLHVCQRHLRFLTALANLAC